MQLYQTNEIHYDRDATLCRVSPLSQTIGALIVFTIAVASPVLCFVFRGPIFFLVVFTLMGLLLSWASIHRIINVNRSSNWALAIQHDGLLINLRSFQNGGFAEALTVLQVPFSELEGARIHSTQIATFPPGRKGAARNRPVYVRQSSLDLELKTSLQTQDLEAAISEESRRKKEGSVLGMKASSRINHIPVSLVQSRTLRIYWSGTQHGLSPILQTVIDELSRHVPILDKVTEAGIDWNKRSDEEFETEIRQMLIEGRKLEAMQLMSRIRRMSLNAAKNEVEAIARQADVA